MIITISLEEQFYVELDKQDYLFIIYLFNK